MEFFNKKTSIRFMATRRRWYAMSAMLIVGSLAAVAFRGLNFGIDFTGGVVLEVAFPEAADLDRVRGALDGRGFGEARVQSFGTSRDVLVRAAAARRARTQPGAQDVLAAIQAQDPSVELRRTEVVGPQVGARAREQGRARDLFTFVGILIYVALALPVEARRRRDRRGAARPDRRSWASSPRRG